jgi:hypothetical protein
MSVTPPRPSGPPLNALRAFDALASGPLVAPFTRRVATNRPLAATLREPIPEGSPLTGLVRRLSGHVAQSA